MRTRFPDPPQPALLLERELRSAGFTVQVRNTQSPPGPGPDFLYRIVGVRQDLRVDVEWMTGASTPAGRWRWVSRGGVASARRTGHPDADLFDSRLGSMRDPSRRPGAHTMRLRGLSEVRSLLSRPHDQAVAAVRRSDP